MRRLLALTAVAVLALTGCASAPDDPAADPSASPSAEVVTDSSLDDVTVSAGAEGAAPTLEFEQPFGVAEPGERVLTEGDGAEITEGQKVLFDYVAVNGTDGTELGSTYGEGQEPQPLLASPGGDATGVGGLLVGKKVGSRVLLALPNAQTTTLLVMDIREAVDVLARAEGEPVTPPEGLPTVTLAENGAPTITLPPGEPPTDLVVQQLVRGSGPAVEEGQTITAHYTGVTWPGGEVFDSSWERGAPAQFPIGTGGVIEGWDTGLVGQPVGSQVLLVVPPAQGYGEQGSPDGSISGTDTLVFVVDILDAG